jgi:predicted O-linked N-acetylglucosamine transferase (SPINDLY family)
LIKRSQELPRSHRRASGFSFAMLWLANVFARELKTFSRSLVSTPQRSLVFLPSQSYDAYLGAIERATLVLDPPWFSGGATSLDAFSVGAPVLTYQGKMARGRQTSGMLEMMKIDALTAKSDDEYVAKAVGLVGDGAACASLRERILENSGKLFEHQRVISALAQFLVHAVTKAAPD